MIRIIQLLLLPLFILATMVSCSSQSQSTVNMHLVPDGKGSAHQPTRILLTGDSLMESLGPQMVAAMKGYKNITLRPIGKRSTGLSRPDYYNWPKVLEENLISFRPQIVVMWVGTNDPQNIYGHKDLGEPLSAAWKNAYADKMREIHNLCKKYKAKLIFIGPPAVAEEPLDAQLLQIEKLMFGFCKRYKLGYVSSRYVLGDRKGRYLHQKSMPNGRMATIRWNDRVHITGDGNRLMMNYLLPYIGTGISGEPSKSTSGW
jgi:hypothetical protein